MHRKPARDQHPDHDVAEGEMLIKEVYEAVRNGPLWNSTLLLITYDEHGGFYVSPRARWRVRGQRHALPSAYAVPVIILNLNVL